MTMSESIIYIGLCQRFQELLEVCLEVDTAQKNLKKQEEIYNYLWRKIRSMENLVAGDNVCIGDDNFIQALGGITIEDNG